jgi:hypothetical protein
VPLSDELRGQIRLPAMKPLVQKLDKLSREQRFVILLVTILVHLVWSFAIDPRGEGPFVRMTIVSFMLLAAIDCLRFEKRSFLTSRLFGAFILLIGWLDVVTVNEWIDVANVLFRTSFFLLVTGALIYQVAITKHVSLGVISAARNHRSGCSIGY